MAKLDGLQSSVNELKAITSVLTDSVGALTGLVKGAYKEAEKEKVFKDMEFPIMTEEDLSKTNLLLDEETRVKLTAVVANILKRGKISKTIRDVLGGDILLEYNIEGTKNQKRLKDHDRFYSALLDAIVQVDESELPEKILGKVLLCAKNLNSANKKRKAEEQANLEAFQFIHHD
nr:uncharacterized protein LOC121503273 [Drosophila kikkawai]